MRPIVAALAAVLTVPLVIVSGGLTQPDRAAAAPAAAVNSPGLYQPVTRVRALDTRSYGKIPAGSDISVQVTGLGEVPASGVVAVSVNLTVLNPAVSGSLSVYALWTNFSGATMSFQAGHTVQNFETVPIVAGQYIGIRNNAGAAIDLIVDVVGYHAEAAPGDSYGLYQPMTPTRLLDTRTGQPVGAGQTRTIQVAGYAGIPAAGSSPGGMAAVVNFTVLSPSKSGSLTVGTDNLARNTPSISFAAGQTEQSQLLMGLDSGGALPVRNNSGAAVQLIADVVGYYTGITQDGNQTFFADDSYARAYDSRATGSAPVPAGGTVDVDVLQTALNWGQAPNGVSAGSINVTVLNPSTDGSISVWPADTAWDGAATVSFTAGQNRQRMLMAKVGAGPESGIVRIRNNSSAPITLIVDLNGWSA
ncbi:MAG TPA: hypothetical protein VFU36_15435 [Jatrophihabitans sp.]|nr:hypothetical protein [Jatrophihabitans sp.]